MRLLDTHFHLDYYRNHKYWYDQLNELKQYTLCVTNSPEVYHSCKRLYKETTYLKFALGYNPKVCLEIPLSKSLFLHEIETTNYVGEVGLDFSREFETAKDTQIKAFEFICRASAERGKLLSVHSRKAEKETLNILKKSAVRKAIIHWYTGDLDTLMQLLNEGYYFSVNANMCTTAKGKGVLSRIPVDRLLIESDGPFSKINSKNYTPTELNKIYSTVGETIGLKNINEVVWKNFANLFKE